MSVLESTDEYRERFALVLADFGMQRMAARVFAALLVTQQPTLTAPELAAQLDASAGAVSGAVKVLLNTGLIERVPAPGSRRDHYRVADDGFYQALMRKNSQVIEAMRALADAGVVELGDDTTAGRRLVEMRDFYSFIQKEVLVLLEHWRAQRERRGA